MNPCEPVRITCPYCGEPLEIAIDSSAGCQHYIEDCQVCCHPMHLRISIDADGLPVVEARREDE